MTSTSQPPATRRNRIVTIRKWGVTGALTVGLLVVVGWLVLPNLLTSQATRDARDVFCLQPAQLSELADAAQALGVTKAGSSAELILTDGTSTSPLRWRQERPEEFDRTCDALSRVQGKPVTQAAGVSGVAGIVLPLLTAVLSAALAYVSTRRQNRATVGQSDAKELRDGVTAYRDAVNKLLDDRKNLPTTLPTAETDAARDALVSRLSAVIERQPRWTCIAEAVAMLRTGELDDGLDRDLTSRSDRTERVARIDELRKRVREVADAGFLAADALANGGDQETIALTRPLREGVPS